jgi:DNA-binding NarL/FixJ family response regulator
MSMAAEGQAATHSEALIRVLLIDEEIVIRTGLRVLIDSWPASQVVGEANRPGEALARMEEINPNLIVCSHPARSNGSLELIRNLIEAVGEIPVVLLTGSMHPQLNARARKAGASWIVSKKHAAIELQRALERVHAGEKWTETRDKPKSPFNTVSDEAGTKTNNRSTGLDERLTKREKQVAIMVSEGCTNRQVGKRLGITEVTVRHHLTSIFNKLRITNRFELIAWLYRNRIVTPLEIA